MSLLAVPETQETTAGEIVLSRLKTSNVKRYLQTTFQHALKTGTNLGTSALGSGDYFEGGDVDLEE